MTNVSIASCLHLNLYGLHIWIRSRKCIVSPFPTTSHWNWYARKSICKMSCSVLCFGKWNRPGLFLYLALKASPTVQLLLPGLNSLSLANPGEQTERTSRPHLIYRLRLVLMIALKEATLYKWCSSFSYCGKQSSWGGVGRYTSFD